MSDIDKLKKKRAYNMIYAAGKIDRKLFEQERLLQQRKYYDYRFMSPVEATDLFAELYTEHYRNQWPRNLEPERKLGRPLKGIKADQREYTSFWTARQRADTLGLPYKFFIVFAMEFIRRGGWQNLDYLPRPNQLMTGRFATEAAQALSERWKERMRFGEHLSDLPQYKVEHFRDMPVQRTHRQAVLDRARKVGKGHCGMDLYCYEMRVISEDQTIAGLSDHGGFDLEILRNRKASRKPVEEVILSDADFWPSCYMVPFSFDEGSEDCIACPMATDCERAQGIIKRAIEKRYGTEEPLLERKRAQQRKRTARHRAKRKAENVSTRG